MAAYTAEIRIGVTGQRDLEQLRSSITQVNTAVDSLNRTRLNAGGITQSLSNLQGQLARAARGLADVQLGSEGLTGALRNYVNVLGAANTAQRDRNRLIDEEIRSRQGLQSLQDRELEYWRRRNAVQSGRFRQQQLEEETAATQRLAAELEDANRAWQMFEHLGKLQHTQELESAAGAFEKFKNETIAGNNALERRIQLSNQLGRIQQSVNATQERLSVDNSAAMMRQANMARMYREQNPVGNTPLLPYGDPTLAAIRGGARRVGSQREIAGGARTQDEAAATLRWAQATQQLIAPLNQVDAILRGIAQETARISSTPLLPSSEMLNAGGRRIQRLQPTLLGPGTAAGEAGFRGAQRSQAEQTAAASARARRSESLALGVGFPLMFGAGPGMLAGSLAGSFAGSGFGGQILGGALGSKLDELGKQAGATAEALRDPQNALAKLAEAGVKLGEKTEFAIKRLTESGRLTEAQALLQKKLADVVGTDGVYALQSLEEANKTLAIESGKLALILQTELAPALEFVAKIATESIRILLGPQTQRKAADINPQAFQRAQERAAKEAGGSLFGGSTGKYESILNKLSEDIIRTTINSKQIKAAQLTPDSAEAQYQASLQKADDIKAAYREGFQLERQAQDLRLRSIDLQRNLENEIFNKEQQLAQRRIDVAERQSKILIDAVDLEYKKRISNEEDRVAEVLAAEAEYVKIKATGAATIEAQRRKLELDIEKQQRDSANYIYGVNKDVHSLRIAAADYERAVIDYREKVHRKITEEQRIQAAVSNTFGTPGSVGTTAQSMMRVNQSTVPSNLYTGRGANASANSAAAGVGIVIRGPQTLAELQQQQRFNTPEAKSALKAPENATSMVIMTEYEAALKTVKNVRQVAIDIGKIQNTNNTLNKQNTDISTQSLNLTKQEQKLREQAALDRLSEIARGPLELAQRRNTVALAEAELGVIKAVSSDAQDRLAFEAQAAVKIQKRKDDDAKILANTQLQGEARTQLEIQLKKGLSITEQQIALDLEALKIAQQTRFEKEQAALQAQLGVTGTGLRAGFIGQAGQAFESEMLKSGDPAKAAMLAEQTQALELATTKARALENAYQDIGTAMATTLTEGVAGLVAGTTTAQQVFSDFLKGVGDALMKAAQQMIAQYLAIAAARALAGLFGGGSLGGGGAGGAADGSGFGATAFGGGGTFGSQGFQMPSILGRAVGGPVTGNTPYMVGEKGPELFVPSSSGSIVPADRTAAMARYQRQGGGTGGAGGGAEDQTAMTNGLSPSIDVSYTVERINSVSYVTDEQFQVGLRQAAKQGATLGRQQVMSDLTNKRSVRSRLGL